MLVEIIRIGVILSVGSAMAWAGSQGSVEAFGLPLFTLCALIALLLNWAIFLPSFLAQTEHYFDLTGTLTYLILMACAFFFNPHFDLRTLLLAGMVVLWSVRLGAFLFRRVRRAGSDGRFDSLKPYFARYLMVWTLQALWVFLTACCALAAMTSAEKVPLGWWALVGFMVFAAGFCIEVVADAQKSAFRANPDNRGRFIESGLWAWSQHPNYFGDITLWLGVTLVAVPTLSGWQFATLIAPVFVFFLLTRISGVPLLRRRAEKAWGNDPDYRAYVKRTPVLIMRPPRTAR